MYCPLIGSLLQLARAVLCASTTTIIPRAHSSHITLTLSLTRLISCCHTYMHVTPGFDSLWLVVVAAVTETTQQCVYK